MSHSDLANQLRRGNYVMNAGGNWISITAEKLSDLENRLIILREIELTKEILVDVFGFRKIGDDDYSNYVIGELNANFKRELVLFIGDNGEVFYDSTLLQIKTVHHLQNLYQALNLKELKVKK